jgi:hypothetical protein
MGLVRNILATLLFIIGFLTLAGGVFQLVLGPASRAVGHLPVRPEDALPGVIVMVIGMAILWVSRLLDGDRGPVRSYRSRPARKKAPVRAPGEERHL